MIKDLKKFELYRPFINALSGDFEPVLCSPEERRQWLVRLEQLKGTTPYEEFDSMVEFLIAWGVVREVRHYDDGRTFVRYEISELLYGWDEVRRFQLLARYSSRRFLQGYTVVHETGGAEPIRDALLCEQSKGKGSRNVTTTNPTEILSFIDTMQKNDFIVISVGDDCFYLAQVYTDESDPKPEFTIEWQCGSLMWQCAAWTKSRQEVRHFFDVYMNEGLIAVQMLFKRWKLVDWKRERRRKGKSIEIDRFLSAQLLCAIRKGDNRKVRYLTELGLSADLNSVKANKFEVRVDGGTDEEMLKQLRKKANELEPNERRRVLAYLSYKQKINGTRR